MTGKKEGKKAAERRWDILKQAAAFMLALVLCMGCFAAAARTETQAAGTGPYGAHGRLRVSGTQIVDRNGKTFQLRGISTHGINWDVGYPYVNKSAFQTLRDDWGANAVRLAMYTHEYNGYCSGGNQTSLKQTLYNGVQAATDLGLYAIIDWHVLNDQNPLTYLSQAKVFWNEISAKYASSGNVIYEICNEPNNCSWEDIKKYANTIIPIIRKNDPNAIIIVGTPTWSQLGYSGDSYETADSPLTGYSNIMYALHFYAAEWSHSQYLRTKLQKTINRGVPVIVSEFGLSAASGNGNIDTGSADTWLSLMDQNHVSYFCWSLSNKNESASLLSSSCQKTSGWSEADLSPAGKYIRNAYRARAVGESYNPADNPAVPMASGLTVSYTTHVQSYGWLGWAKNGAMSGTSGLAKRLEGIRIKVSGGNLGIQYQTHVQTYGWQGWVVNGATSGTTGQAKRLEAIRIRLTGADQDKYDVYYRVHAQSYGWLDWAKNGEAAGTEGLAKRLEAINIFIVKKGTNPGVKTTRPFVKTGSTGTAGTGTGSAGSTGTGSAGSGAGSGGSTGISAPAAPTVSKGTSVKVGKINYRTHVQSYGWLGWNADGAMNGTSGLGKRLEAIRIDLADQIAGSVEYRTHVQTYGWLNWVRDGAVSGTEGQAKRLEAVCIRLQGAAAQNYDIYYRVHVQSYGWLGWAKNGAPAGTQGQAKRLEAIQIVLVNKGGKAPGSTAGSFRS